jgi:flagellum-specific peptidoglycan hydrolase FlgJ
LRGDAGSGYRRAFPTGARLRLLRPVLIVLFALGVVFGDVPEASPMGSLTTGASLRGPGARARAAMERVRAIQDPADRVAAADALLASLRMRRDDLTELLDAASIDMLARDAVGVRNEALRALDPLPAGHRGAFLDRLVDEAVFVDWSTGVPASVTLAQAILESNWGRSAPGNNLFGMKGAGPAGSTSRRVIEWSGGRRRARTALFRAYETEAQSLADHARVLTESRRYARARGASWDASAYARALTGVYATDPRYHVKLGELSNGLRLSRFDWHASPEPSR